MASVLAAFIAVASVLWTVWVGALIERPFYELLPAIGVMLGFGWLVGYWIGDARFGTYTVLGLAVIATAITLSGLASGAAGAGLPLLVGGIPALLSAPLAYAGGKAADRRRGTRWR